jgi:hypothetical protein
MFVRSREQYGLATGLLGLGLEPAEVATGLGIPVATVRTWDRRVPRSARVAHGALTRWRPPNPSAYSYLLGLYLGDGCITKHARGSSSTFMLSIDAAHERVIEDAATAIGRVIPEVAVRRHRRRARCVVVQASHPVWPVAFPQHGPGKKHLRAIRLEPWQREVTHAHPRELIRGLIHSDGCRSVNRFRTQLPSGRIAEYAYARYFFSNLSEDIKQVFCDHCDLLGIRHSRANPRYVSVHDRASVELLDAFVGPKR